MAELKQIGPYNIIAKIASGGMGTVYHAQHTQMQREVALKVMHPSFGEDSDFVTRFKREVTATAALRHPNIIEVYDANNADGFHYLAMEYIAGGSLQSYLAKLREDHQKMPINAALKVVRQIAMALDYAHSKGFVHRDIKPSNIMIAAEDRYILTDFGIVQQEGAAKLTKTVAAIGTPEYMSPEQAQGQHVDGRSDIYSLGVVLYEMIAGVPPFTGDTSWAVIFRHVKEPPPPINKLRPEVTPAVRNVVEKALAKSPGDRFQTAAEFASAIDNVLNVRKAKPSILIPVAIGIAAVVTISAVGAILFSVLAAQPAAPPTVLAPTVTAVPAKAIASTSTVAPGEATATAGVSPSPMPTLTSAPTATPEPAGTSSTGITDTATPALQAKSTATLAPVATPTDKPVASPTPAATSAPAATSVPVATSAPAAPGMVFAAPALAGPASGSSFQLPAIPHLTWASVGALGADDYYFVEIDHAKGVDPTYTKDTAIDAKDYLVGLQRQVPFTWRVSVVRKIGSTYTTISPSSGNWTFNWTQASGGGGGGGGGGSTPPKNTPIPP